MIVSYTCQQNPSQKSHSSWLCSRQKTKKCGSASLLVLFYTPESPQISPTCWRSSHSSRWRCCGQDVKLHSVSDRPVQALRKGGTLLRPAAVTCRRPQEAGWSGRKPCKPPASADPLRNFRGRWNLLFILWPVQERLVWSLDGEMNMDSFHCENGGKKKISPLGEFFFFSNKTFHLKYSSTVLWEHAP